MTDPVTVGLVLLWIVVLVVLVVLTAVFALARQIGVLHTRPAPAGTLTTSADTKVGMRFEVGKLPCSVLISPDGARRSKGLVNSREHLENLVGSMDSGIESIQDYLFRPEGLEQKAS